MYQQRIEEKRNELENAQVMVRAARKAVVDAEGAESLCGAELVKLRTDLIRAEENAFWLAAELDALNELQAELRQAGRVPSQ